MWHVPRSEQGPAFTPIATRLSSCRGINRPRAGLANTFLRRNGDSTQAHSWSPYSVAMPESQ